MLTVLIQSYRAYWNCAFVESHGILLPFVGFVRVYVGMPCIPLHPTFLTFSSIFLLDFAVLQ